MLLKRSGGLCSRKPSGFAKQLPEIRVRECKEATFEHYKAAPMPPIALFPSPQPGGFSGLSSRARCPLPLCEGRRGQTEFPLLLGGLLVGAALAPSPAAITPAAPRTAMMPCCRNGRGGLPLLPLLTGAAGLGLGSSGHVLCQVPPSS